MGMDSLRDLSLAGVNWELTDARSAPVKSTEHRAESKDIESLPDSLQSQTSMPVAVAPTAPVASTAAQRAAIGTGDPDALCAAIAAFDHPLRQFVRNVVLPKFAAGSRLLIITDSPSMEDDESGTILSGAAGELMNKMLNAIGLNRDDVSILPLVFWRAPGGRTPSREELDMAQPFVDRAIELLQPSVILTLGSLAAEEIANAKLPRQHGEIIESVKCRVKSVNNDESTLYTLHSTLSVIPIFHPNFLILKPDAKRQVWDALQKLEKLLKTAEK